MVGRGPTLGYPAGLAAWVGLGHPGAWAVPAAKQKFGGRGWGAGTPAAAVLWARGFRFVYLRQIIAAFTSFIPEVLNGSRSLRLSRAASTTPVQAAGTPCRSPRCGGGGVEGTSQGPAGFSVAACPVRPKEVLGNARLRAPPDLSQARRGLVPRLRGRRARAGGSEEEKRPTQQVPIRGPPGPPRAGRGLGRHPRPRSLPGAAWTGATRDVTLPSPHPAPPRAWSKKRRA